MYVYARLYPQCIYVASMQEQSWVHLLSYSFGVCMFTYVSMMYVCMYAAMNHTQIYNTHYYVFTYICTHTHILNIRACSRHPHTHVHTHTHTHTQHQGMQPLAASQGWSAPPSARSTTLGSINQQDVTNLEEGAAFAYTFLSDSVSDAGNVTSWGDPLQSRDTVLRDNFLQQDMT